MRMTVAMALAAATLPVPALAAEVQIAVQGPVVEMTVNEVVRSAPDTATVGAGVSTRAPTATAAMQQNAAAMDKVIARLRALGIARDDIQTASISLSPQYQYNNDNTPPRFLGYEAANQVSVILHDLDRVGGTLDALVSAGATNINGPSFSLDKDEAARATARKNAFQRAQSEAMEFARLAGFSGLRLLEVSEAFTGRGPVPYAADAVMVTAQRVAKTPVEPGQVGTGVNLTVKYEMTR